MLIFITIASLPFIIIANTSLWQTLFLLLWLRSKRKRWHCLTSLRRLSFFVHTITKHVKQQQQLLFVFGLQNGGNNSCIHTYIYCCWCFVPPLTVSQIRIRDGGHDRNDATIVAYLYVHFGRLVNEWAHNRFYVHIFYIHIYFFCLLIQIIFSIVRYGLNFFFASNFAALLYLSVQENLQLKNII